MKKQTQQQLVRLKTLVDSNDDDPGDTTSSASNDDSDRSSKITDLMRQNERKMRSLSESYMNRFLMIGQLQSLPPPSTALAIPSSSNNQVMVPRRSSAMDSESMLTTPSFNLFIETMKQLIIREEKKRGLSIVVYNRFSNSLYR